MNEKTGDEFNRMIEVELSAEKSYPNDRGSSIARLDPDSMLQLNLSPGDVIEIEGGATTVGKGWRLDRNDWDTETVRLDAFTRRNADISSGERITIRTPEVRGAETIGLAPNEVEEAGITSDASGLKRQIVKRPAVEGDILPVLTSPGQFRRLGQAVEIVVVETVPSGIVLINEDTDLLWESFPG